MGIEALVLTGKLNLTFYGAVYLAVARKLKSILITGDERLRKTAKKAKIKTKKTLEIRG